MKIRSIKLLFLFFFLAWSSTSKLFSQTISIGTTLPARATLEVHGAGGTGFTSGLFGGDGAGISLQRNWPSVGFNQYNDGVSRYLSNGFAANQFCNPSTGEFGIDMINSGNANAVTGLFTRALSFNTAGNIGMRTSATSASLYAIRGTNTSAAAIFAGTNYISAFSFSANEDTYINAGKSGSNVYINESSSGAIIVGSGSTMVGINTATPNATLQVNEVGQSGILLTEANQAAHHWEQSMESYGGGPQSAYAYYYDGQLKCYFRPTDGILIVASDRRIKTNITPMPPVLEKILQLKPLRYEMKYNNPDHRLSWGFLAQDVQKLFPKMVTVSSHQVKNGLTIPDFHALDYNDFKIIAVKGVQEEQLMIDKQQDLQDNISKRLDAIEKKLLSGK